MDNSGSTSHIVVQGGTHVISAPITLAGNLSVAPTATSTLTLSGDISESTVGSALSLDDAGTLILSGSNGYTGGTNVNAGTLVVENVNGIPNGSNLTVGAGAASLFGSPAAGGVVLGGAEVAATGGNSAAVAFCGARAWHAGCCSWQPLQCGGLPPLFETVEDRKLTSCRRSGHPKGRKKRGILKRISNHPAAVAVKEQSETHSNPRPSNQSAPVGITPTDAFHELGSATAAGFSFSEEQMQCQLAAAARKLPAKSNTSCRSFLFAK